MSTKSFSYVVLLNCVVAWALSGVSDANAQSRGSLIRSKLLSYECLQGNNKRCPASKLRLSAILGCALNSSKVHRLERLGARLNSRIGAITTLDMPMRRLRSLRSLCHDISVDDGLTLQSFEESEGLGAPSTLENDSQSIPAMPGLVGSNVVIGIVDTGIDINHEDFRTATDTRIKYIWDQTIVGTPPEGFTYGSDYSSTSFFPMTSPTPPGVIRYSGTDDLGHGTHIAGVAASNGKATGNYAGIAPESDIVAVKLSPSPYGSYTDAQVIDGVKYVFDKAAVLGKPAVVLLAVGSLAGPKDGSSSFETALTAMTGPGKLIVSAAGNEKGRSRHAEITTQANDQTKEMSVVVPTYVAAGNAGDYFLVEGWYNYDANYEVLVEPPLVNGQPVVLQPVARGTQFYGQTPAGVIAIKNGVTTSSNGSFKVELQVSRGSLAYPVVKDGTWNIKLKAKSAGVKKVDAWLTSWLLGSVAPAFGPGIVEGGITQGKTETRLVQSPATANNIISVGSYTTQRTWTDINGSSRSYYYAVMNQIANYSSPGPRRDGTILPHVTAPGYGVISALSSQAFSSISSTYHADERNVSSVARHFMNSGTSVAAAKVAGRVAQFLEQNRQMTPAEAIERLQDDALADSFTQGVPNSTWGAGKFIDPVGFLADLRLVKTLIYAPDGSLSYTVKVCQPTSPVGSCVPKVGATVELIIDNAALSGLDLRLCSDQSPTLNAVTNSNGEVVFNLKGGGCVTSANLASFGLNRIGQIKVNGLWFADITAGVSSDVIRATPGVGVDLKTSMADAVNLTNPIQIGNSTDTCADLNRDGEVGLSDGVILTLQVMDTRCCAGIGSICN